MKEVFRKIEVEIDLCEDPRIRDMFTRPEAGREVKVFVEKHGLKLSGAPNHRNEITDIEVTGSDSSLQAFIDEFLSDSPHAYAVPADPNQTE